MPQPWCTPFTPPASPGEVWVRWRDDAGNVFVSTGHYDPTEGFVFLQPAIEPQRIDNYTFDYIGTVTGWKPLILPAAT